VPIVLKSGSLNLLEPSGPVQACNGFALLLLLPVFLSMLLLLRSKPFPFFDNSTCVSQLRPLSSAVIPNRDSAVPWGTARCKHKKEINNIIKFSDEYKYI
jgi:hypothetical protein